MINTLDYQIIYWDTHSGKLIFDGSVLLKDEIWYS